MKTIVVILAAALFGGCATARLETRVAELERQLAAKSTPALPPTAIGATNPPVAEPLLAPPTFGVPMGYPLLSSVHVNTRSPVSRIQQHIVHNFTEDVGVAVREGMNYLPMDTGAVINLDLADGTGQIVPNVSVIPPILDRGELHFRVAFQDTGGTRSLTFLCIRMQPNGIGKVVGRHSVQVPFGRGGGYGTVDSRIDNFNCVGNL